MKLIDPHYDICMDAFYDAGYQNMKKHGRTSWNSEDWDCAADAYHRLREEAKKEASE